jgi:hypothetical protein
VTISAVPRRSSRLAVAVLLLIGFLALGGAPAEATDPAPNKCGGRSTTVPTPPKSCFFFSKGIPIRFHATSSTPGTARVWISVDGNGYPDLNGVSPIGCSAASGRTSCGGGYPDETTIIDFPHQASSAFVKLRCHFAGSGATWEYGCSAGS